MKPRTGDFVIAVCVLLIAAAIWAFPFFADRGSVAVIRQDGELVAELPLSTEEELQISECTVKVENGAVYIKKANCPDHVCINTGRISKQGETIICVPNRISIKISGDSEFDAIAG